MFRWLKDLGTWLEVLNLSQMLEYYLKHQEEVVTRRTQYDLNRAEERAHILEGLLKALDNIDEVIHIVGKTDGGTPVVTIFIPNHSNFFFYHA